MPARSGNRPTSDRHGGRGWVVDRDHDVSHGEDAVLVRARATIAVEADDVGADPGGVERDVGGPVAAEARAAAAAPGPADRVVDEAEVPAVLGVEEEVAAEVGDARAGRCCELVERAGEVRRPLGAAAHSRHDALAWAGAIGGYVAVRDVGYPGAVSDGVAAGPHLVGAGDGRGREPGRGCCGGQGK